jgi:hypothetical protein
MGWQGKQVKSILSRVSENSSAYEGVGERVFTQVTVLG